MNVGEGNGKIYLGIPRERFYMTQFVDNRDTILAHLFQIGKQGGFFQADGHRVDNNRDKIVKNFLETGHEWLLFLDSDMIHPVHVADRLLKWNKPIVGGLYFQRGKQHSPLLFKYLGLADDKQWPGRKVHMWGSLRDEVYDFLTEADISMQDGSFVIDGLEDQALVECDAVATGCMLIHRSVFEAMKPPWFEYLTGGNSEDLVFCKRVKDELGLPIYCDLSTISGHFELVPMGQAQFRMQYEDRGMHFASYTPETAIKWLMKFYNISEEEATQELESSDGHNSGHWWNTYIGSKKVTPKRVIDFYKDDETGRQYITELLHWNATPAFTNIRKLLSDVRKQNVLEIGAGIGTIALQLVVQRNNVVAAEVNEILKDFTKMRYDELDTKIETELGGFATVGTEWMQDLMTNSMDVVVAIDVLEHMTADVLKDTIHHVARVLHPGGMFYYHNSWGGQELYPQHFNHSELWANLMQDSGFMSLSPYQAMRVGPK